MLRDFEHVTLDSGREPAVSPADDPDRLRTTSDSLPDPGSWVATAADRGDAAALPAALKLRMLTEIDA